MLGNDPINPLILGRDKDEEVSCKCRSGSPGFQPGRLRRSSVCHRGWRAPHLRGQLLPGLWIQSRRHGQRGIHPARVHYPQRVRCRPAQRTDPRQGRPDAQQHPQRRPSRKPGAPVRHDPRVSVPCGPPVSPSVTEAPAAFARTGVFTFPIAILIQ
jgi:hypothetical protein